MRPRAPARIFDARDPLAPLHPIADKHRATACQAGSETSINKLHRAALEVEMGELAMEITGSASTLMRGSDVAPENGRWADYALGWPEVVIGGGTPNIQKNIIAERILGLPKD